MSSQPAHLEPSKLGTKKYWDDLYTTEIRNHAADSSDIGTCWFDDSDAENRILRFLASLTDDDDDDDDEEEYDDDEEEEKERQNGCEVKLSRSETSFLDLGCGNGSLLFSLRDKGWQGRMRGIDYSAQSIALAKQISVSREAESEESESEPQSQGDPAIDFAEWDLISGPLQVPLHNGSSSTSSCCCCWDVVLDKGTFDAISLSSETGPRGHRLVELYRERMLQLVNPRGGIFLITSCNWTEDELRAWFEAHDDGELKVVAKVDYPTFTFGGVKGQTITTLCFQRKSR